MFKTAVAWQKSSVPWDGAKEEYKTKVLILRKAEMKTQHS